MTEKQLMQYEEDFKIYNDSMASLYCEREEGREEGRAEGRAEGEAIGIERTAKAMKAEGLPLETIIRITGLTETAISAL